MDLRSNTWTTTPTEDGLQKHFQVNRSRDFYMTFVVEGLGLTYFERVNGNGPGGGLGNFDRVQLEYALVAGEPYGLPVLPTTDVEEDAPVAMVFASAYPNPFRTSTTLVLSLRAAEAVTLEAFDVLGRRVLWRDLGVQPVGESRHVLDGSALPAGVYVVRATTASGETATRRVVRVE